MPLHVKATISLKAFFLRTVTKFCIQAEELIARQCADDNSDDDGGGLLQFDRRVSRLSRFPVDRAIEDRRLREPFSPVTRAASSPRSGFSLFVTSSTTISPWCHDFGVANLCPRLWSATVMVERKEERKK
ncbi:hypothetical protein TIFTF001_011390 [Ficus carica]|uniref:Uncharacterized protein n=1 Tax=Ficus carica TaxID=3494 RepID=A0AA87ZYK5_FICCA|nr:hypothetical protein TIFTF001_011390 [Ficus carica]